MQAKENNQLYVDNGVLYRLFSDSGDLNVIPQLVVPESQKERVLYGVHEGIGGRHLGIEKCVAKLKERFYWSGHYNDVKDWCANCGIVLPGRLPHHIVKLHS